MSSLSSYKKKRNLKSTSEPKARMKRVSKESPYLFVVQKHQASHLHYDFRLELKGVLKSWAIPKGPSLNPSDKRLAIMVEDHPFDYKSFEGTIPPGNYGAGTVMVWDYGTYHLPKTLSKKEIEKEMIHGLAKGHLEIILEGKKLKGAFTLIKISGEGMKNDWLLIKKKDGFTSSQDVTENDRSAQSGRTMQEIAKEKSGQWQSTKKTSSKRTKKQLLSQIDTKPFEKMPKEIRPMLATLVNEPFNDEEWLFEIKWDGYRTLAYIKDKKVELLSRNQNSFNQLFPAIVQELESMEDDLILDGEVVVVDKTGKSHFQLMQNYQTTQEGSLLFYVFDLLYLNGHDLRKMPLIKRKEILQEVLNRFSGSLIRYSDHILKQGIPFFKEAKKKHLEGILAKKIESLYQMKRSRDWLKIKIHRQQEVVIGGFTSPRGSRKKFGALLVGVYKNKQLHYVGHVGGGFTQQSLIEIHQLLLPLVQDHNPFVDKITPNAPVNWVKPILVGEVSFSEWTSEGYMRQPIFLGLRIDKSAKQVRREG